MCSLAPGESPGVKPTPSASHSLAVRLTCPAFSASRVLGIEAGSAGRLPTPAAHSSTATSS